MDEYSQLGYVYPLPTKTEASEVLLQCVNRFEKQAGHAVTEMYTNCLKDFSRAKMTINDNGVGVTTKTVNTPQYNGLAKKTHQTILNDVWTCLEQAKFSEGYLLYPFRQVFDACNTVPDWVTYEIFYVSVIGE